MILLIDNYDSFVYNVYQYLSDYAKVKLVRNDAITLTEIEQLQPELIVYSPGPGRPEQAGNMQQMIQHFYKQIPMLGICLGHQAICQVFGERINYAPSIMHGKTSKLQLLKKDVLFTGIDDVRVARYHSLVCDCLQEDSVLEVLAVSEDNQIMAVKHKEALVYGVQFHPESILTTQGKKMIENLMGVIQHDQRSN
ncbi:anthranilate synthase component 2 [Erysipelotrichaceae bacterium MTC7]|nr:anthranilate synthase component 2 [Erysipelotrichaceae bacterium MTC7]